MPNYSVLMSVYAEEKVGVFMNFFGMGSGCNSTVAKYAIVQIEGGTGRRKSEMTNVQ